MGLTALSGLLTFVAAAFIAWYFAVPETAVYGHPDLAINPFWHQLDGQLGQPMQPIIRISLPRPTTPIFDSKINRSSIRIFTDSALHVWSQRSKWSFNHIITKGSPLYLNPFHLYDPCQTQIIENNPGDQKRWESSSNPGETHRLYSHEQVRNMSQDINGVVCVESSTEVHAPLQETFPAITLFFVPNAVEQRITLLLRGKDISEPMKYSIGHTFLMQTSGSSQIMASQHLEHLHLFPFTSPLRGQSQITHAVLHSNASLPEIQNATFQITVLREGEVLYIPPFWAYSTVALEPSSIFVVQSHTQIQGEASNIADLPFEEWLPEIATPQASFYLALVFDRLRGDFDLPFHEFAAQIIRERFSTLPPYESSQPIECERFSKIESNSVKVALNSINDRIMSSADAFYSLPYPHQIEIVKDGIENIALASNVDSVEDTLKCWAQQIDSLDIMLDLFKVH